MLKTISIIILSVTFFGVLFLFLVKNSLKRKLEDLVKNEKNKNQIILINLLNSSASIVKYSFRHFKTKTGSS